MKRSSIAIIGVGAVGSTIAYTLLAKNSVAEIILIDVNTERCDGEVLDLADCIGFSRTSRIYHGTYQDAKKADIVIIAAGRAQKPSELRSALLETNKAILKTIMEQLHGLRHDALIIIVANPLDTLTYYAQQWSELPHSQIFGTGTFLDSQRLKHFLSSFTQIAVHSIESFIVGEHGESQVVAWSHTRIAGNLVEQYGITEKMKQEFSHVVKTQAYEIIKAKG
ncbi:NAD(P)-binding domain-containing protein, partial [Candidatus Dependentiae bacterium]|nr:NAD(P)-binding domain-containing protein [Candidatus Dependentiae bacterium]